MNAPTDIEGREFDWFSIDQDGRYALFATAGYGIAPEVARVNAATYDAIGEFIPVTGWGSDAVWQSYARVGLYAYDWSVMQGCYVRVALPEVVLPPQLADELAACKAIHSFDGSFSKTGMIWPEWRNGDS
ncbi:MAG: hypothetical protein HOQ32_02150 [Lysobacter sp.]|nr:hypothetical protein [Lysobacter sp.]